MAERKKQYWGEERNARRRERYASDPAYRQRMIEQTRHAYRRDKNVRQEDCRENLPMIDRLAKATTVQRPDGSTAEARVLYVPQMAKVINRNPQVLNRWIAKGYWPEPTLIEANSKLRVFTVAEAEALCRVFGAHQIEAAYYRPEHTETRAKLFQAVGAKEAKQAA